MNLTEVAAPRLDGANCTGRWDLFDEPDPGDDDAGYLTARAVALCHDCPVLSRCREWFASLPPGKRPSGVVAGRLRRSQRRPADQNEPKPEPTRGELTA